VRDHRVETSEHDVSSRSLMQATTAAIGHQHLIRRLAHLDAGRIETDTHSRAAVEHVIGEAGFDDIVHGGAGRDAGNKRTHQKTRESGVSVREMVDVRLLPGWIPVFRKTKALKARIAKVANIRRRHRVAANTEEAQRATLEAIGSLLAHAPYADQIVAVT